MHPIITSHQNPKIKNILLLEKARERSRQLVFVFEGMKELELATAAGYELISVFFCPDIVNQETVLNYVSDQSLVIPVERSVFEKVTYREGTEGILVVAKQRGHALSDIRLRKNPFVIVLESVEKPGNLGAILRTADAAAVDAVIICEPKTDFYNPNVVRSSVGCLFTVQTASASVEETLQWLKENEIKALVTDLEAAQPYYAVDYTLPSALVLGTESTGISEVWRKNADSKIIIPMRGKIDSMNVSNAAAVIVFEAMRQRGF